MTIRERVKDLMMFIQDFDELVDQIKEQYHRMEKEVDNSYQRIRDFNKDEEIQNANRSVEDIRRRALTVLSDKEAEDIERFKTEHYQRHTPHTKTSGSTYIYTLTGTGVGTAISIKCPICGEEKNVTEK